MAMDKASVWSRCLTLVARGALSCGPHLDIEHDTHVAHGGESLKGT